MNKFTIGELFTASEIKAAVSLSESCKPGQFNALVVEKVINPALERINKTTGQENDPRYLGYLLEYGINNGE